MVYEYPARICALTYSCGKARSKRCHFSIFFVSLLHFLFFSRGAITRREYIEEYTFIVHRKERLNAKSSPAHFRNFEISKFRFFLKEREQNDEKGEKIVATFKTALPTFRIALPYFPLQKSPSQREDGTNCKLLYYSPALSFHYSAPLGVLRNYTFDRRVDGLLGRITTVTSANMMIGQRTITVPESPANAFV